MMNFLIYTDSVSPHQVPVATRLRRLWGETGFKYVYFKGSIPRREKLGWQPKALPWMLLESHDPAWVDEHLLSDAFLLTGERRLFNLIRQRAEAGRVTFFMSERWFKPWAGMLRLLKPSFVKMAFQISRLFQNENFYYLPTGIHAARDMARLIGLLNGHISCLWRSPNLDFDKVPGGKVRMANGDAGNSFGLPRMRLWGYFVEASKWEQAETDILERCEKTKAIRIVWMGRCMTIKRVDTIMKAVGVIDKMRQKDASVPRVTLDIYGCGEAEQKIKKEALKHKPYVSFHGPVSIVEVRNLLHEYDLYILSTGGWEGWGATMSEALEENAWVIGTYEAGSSATILPEECLYHAGDYLGLANKILGKIHRPGIGAWSADVAATALMQVVREHRGMTS